MSWVTWAVLCAAGLLTVGAFLLVRREETWRGWVNGMIDTFLDRFKAVFARQLTTEKRTDSLEREVTKHSVAIEHVKADVAILKSQRHDPDHHD